MRPRLPRSSYEKSRFSYEQRPMRPRLPRSSHEESRFSYEESPFSYEGSAFSYEESRFSYEESRFSYEESRFSYEKSAFSYEESRFSYEKSAFSYEESRFSYEETPFDTPLVLSRVSLALDARGVALPHVRSAAARSWRRRRSPGEPRRGIAARRRLSHPPRVRLLDGPPGPRDGRRPAVRQQLRARVEDPLDDRRSPRGSRPVRDPQVRERGHASPRRRGPHGGPRRGEAPGRDGAASVQAS